MYSLLKMENKLVRRVISKKCTSFPILLTTPFLVSPSRWFYCLYTMFKVYLLIIPSSVALVKSAFSAMVDSLRGMQTNGLLVGGFFSCPLFYNVFYGVCLLIVLTLKKFLPLPFFSFFLFWKKNTTVQANVSWYSLRF